MKNILLMETGSFSVIGGAAKDVYKLYRKLSEKKGYNVDLFGDFSKIDPTVRTISFGEMISRNYDLVWMNSIRDISVAETYRKSHFNSKTKFLYVDRGNVLLNFHNAGVKKLLPKMIARRFLTHRMKRWLDYYVAISVDQYSFAKKFFTDRTKVKYIMISAHEEFKVMKKQDNFKGAISVSRLDERQKKMSFMIKGLAKLLDMHPELSGKLLLRIYGTGIDEQNYKNMVEKLNLGPNISFKGFVTGDDLLAAYGNGAFFVSTSEWEGLGRSLLEAMACGLPLLINQNINTLIKLNPQTRIVKDGYNGLVYKYGDEKDFAEKFYRFYNQGSLRRRLSENTKKFMKQFSFSTVLKSYEKIIDEL